VVLTASLLVSPPVARLKSAGGPVRPLTPRCELVARRSVEVIQAGQSADAGRWGTREGYAVAAVCCCRCPWLTLNTATALR